MKRKHCGLIILCILLVVTGLVLGSDKGFSGTDDRAEQAINEINSNYKPWFNSMWEPPSSEIESLLFSLQAALGAGFIGYYIGKKEKCSK
ncbi:cobalt transport protein CbiN [Clostridium polyendosporum]|uniref:Cobalt transport protein CbiN n=1 Tax=Clostridium polyendosporum TaxID=69208 RepID=A0A919VDZ2_9CLOT|nr:energy-coupling factor ABC transporter substrate-binding protein [Clostridium polyendosporum]GIM28559.1 cobalt transport protein CbiN [Clostridium polyendosporum]